MYILRTRPYMCMYTFDFRIRALCARMCRFRFDLGAGGFLLFQVSGRQI